jgi:hypothetical protein
LNHEPGPAQLAVLKKLQRDQLALVGGQLKLPSSGAVVNRCVVDGLVQPSMDNRARQATGRPEAAF